MTLRTLIYTAAIHLLLPAQCEHCRRRTDERDAARRRVQELEAALILLGGRES